VSARVRTRERHNEVVFSHEIEQVKEDEEGEEQTEEMDQTERERGGGGGEEIETRPCRGVETKDDRQPHLNPKFDAATPCQ